MKSVSAICFLLGFIASYVFFDARKDAAKTAEIISLRAKIGACK